MTLSKEERDRLFEAKMWVPSFATSWEIEAIEFATMLKATCDELESQVAALNSTIEAQDAQIGELKEHASLEREVMPPDTTKAEPMECPRGWELHGKTMPPNVSSLSFFFCVLPKNSDERGP